MIKINKLRLRNFDNLSGDFDFELSEKYIR